MVVRNVGIGCQHKADGPLNDGSRGLDQSQRRAVQRRLQLDRDRRPKGLRRMAGSLGVGDEPGNLRVWRRAVDVQIELHLLKGAWRPAQVVLVSHAEGRPHVDVSFFDRNLI